MGSNLNFGPGNFAQPQYIIWRYARAGIPGGDVRHPRYSVEAGFTNGVQETADKSRFPTNRFHHVHEEKAGLTPF